MRAVPTCQRICRRALMTLGGSLGLVLASTEGCEDDVVGAVLISLEDLATSLVQIFFSSLLPEASETTTTTTVQAITETMGWLLT